jgi:hypothetical protein
MVIHLMHVIVEYVSVCQLRVFQLIADQIVVGLLLCYFECFLHTL